MSREVIAGFNPALISLQDVVSKGMASDYKTLNDIQAELENQAKSRAAGQMPQGYKKRIDPLVDTITLNTAGSAISASDFTFFMPVAGSTKWTQNVPTDGTQVPAGQKYLIYGISYRLAGLTKAGTAFTEIQDRLNFIELAQGTVSVEYKSNTVKAMSSVPFEEIPEVKTIAGFVSATLTTQGPSASAPAVNYVDMTELSPDAPSQNLVPEILIEKQTFTVTVHFDNLVQTFTNALKLRMYLHLVRWTPA